MGLMATATTTHFGIADLLTLTKEGR